MNPIRNLRIIFSQKCNFKCKYCYIDQKSDHMITENDFQTIYSFIQTIPKDDKFHIIIFGGEPLVHKELLLKFIKFINNKWHIQIITNGTLLTDKFIQEAIKYRVDFNISLDGCRESHNLTRIDSQGNGTFDKVMDSIELLSKYYPKDKRFIGTCVISPYNFHLLKDDLKFMLDNDMSINLSLANGANWDVYPLEYYKNILQESADYYIENFDKMDEIRFFHLYLTKYLSNKVVCTCGGTMITIGPDKNIYPCPYFLNSDKYSFGNIESDPLNSINRNNFLVEKHSKEIPVSNFKWEQSTCYGEDSDGDDRELSHQLQKLCLDMNLYVHDKLKNNKKYQKFLNMNETKAL